VTRTLKSATRHISASNTFYVYSSIVLHLQS